jgi:hypothetical protein
MPKETAEFAYDLHSGLASLQVPEFDQLTLVGMAAALAIHLKGLGDIEYEVLRKVSDYFMQIPSHALRGVLEILAEIGYIRLDTTGRTINRITPNIPSFDDVYDGIGGYIDNEITLNSHEAATLQIMGELYTAPRNQDALLNSTGIEKSLFDRCVDLGAASGIVSKKRARGRNILISPFYFADNLEGLADIVAGGATPALKSALQKVKDGQGWPLSLVGTTGEIAGYKLSQTEKELVYKLAEEGIVKPPTIKFGSHSESFLFTPRPGNARLNAANREIYERAMALISAIRKGQLLPDAFKIRSPIALLSALRNNGFVRANSEAQNQYGNLVHLRVGRLVQTGSSFWQFHLIGTPENDSALRLAIQLLESGTLANMEVNQEARIALTKDEVYIQSLISSTELRRRERQLQDEQAKHEYEQLILKF